MVQDDPLPLFPLNSVLFPDEILPLHVFEDRYKLLMREHRAFGVVLIRDGWEVGAIRDLYPIGTVATLVGVRPLPEERLFVIARGVRRFRLLDLDTGHPYLQARVDLIDESPRPAGPRMLSLLGRYLVANGVQAEAAIEAGKQADQPVWLAGSVLQVEEVRLQRLLESGDPDLAEQMLAEEVSRLERFGPLNAVRPHRPQLN